MQLGFGSISTGWRHKKGKKILDSGVVEQNYKESRQVSVSGWIYWVKKPEHFQYNPEINRHKQPKSPDCPSRDGHAPSRSIPSVLLEGALG